MVPRTIRRRLSQLRRRERVLRLSWGLGRALTVTLAVLAAACLADWLIDRREETPWALRVALLAVQAVLWVALAWTLVLRPLFRRLSDHHLACVVEEHLPWLRQRLISAVQLNRPGAHTEGMSPELIAAVTQEAEADARGINFAGLVDHRRLAWAVCLAGPFVAVAVLAFVFWPETVQALIARQFLADEEIPRSIRLASERPDILWPSGDDVVLRFRAAGDLDPDAQGEVRVEPEDGGPAESYPLVFESPGRAGEAVYAARVPSSTVNFAYRAWLADARTRERSYVYFEAPPAIIEQHAWVELPEYVGLRADGKPYEQEQPRGDIFGLPQSRARIAIKTQKPVVKATLEIIGKQTRAMPLELGADRLRAHGSFRLADLKPDEHAYRIVVEDEHGFRNEDPPRRSIRVIAEEPPRVALLPERFPAAGEDGEDADVDGVPVLEGGSVRIAYACAHPYGLGRAQLRYRVNDGNWKRLPLSEVHGGSGDFDPRTGAFRNSGWRDQVEFYAAESPDPYKLPGRAEGGGRFDFQTRGIPGLKVGDRLEYYVEVFDRNPDAEREPGRSETRVKAVVTPSELEAWIRQVLQEESRIRRLENRQHGIFAKDDEPEEQRTRPADTAVASTPETPAARAEAPHGAPAGPQSFLRKWQLLGPFATPPGGGYDIAYTPETEKVQLDRVYGGIGGAIRWRLHESPTDRISLDEFFHREDLGVAYAVCWVRSDRAKPAQLSIGSDDGIKIWLDRRLAFGNKIFRNAEPGQDKARVDLKGAWQELLVKVDNGGGNKWAFYLQFQDPNTGQPLDGIEVRTTPPVAEQAAALATTFIRNWQLLGVFPSVNDAGHDTVYPPEQEKVDLAKQYAGLTTKIGWRHHASPTDKIDLQAFFHHGEAGVAYAACWVHSDQKRDALLATGSDDGIKVWLGGKCVLDRKAHREAVPGDDRQPVELAAGWNELLVKVDNTFGTWAFYLELRDPATGKPLPGLRVQTTSPADDAKRFVREWQLVGPFPNPNQSGHDLRYAPEIGRIDLSRQYSGIGGQVRWKPHQSPTDLVDLAKFFARPFEESNVAYAVCWVHADRARNAVLATGSDDGIKVWLNHRLVQDRRVEREAVAGEDTAPVALRAGWNELLVKVDNRFGRWGFYLELRDPATGHALPGLRTQVAPPTGLGLAPRFVRNWLLVGPFSCRDCVEGHRKVYPPEADTFDRGKSYDGVAGRVQWRPYFGADGYIDLAKALNHPKVGVAYAVCWVRSDWPRDVLLRLGSNDGIKVWINRVPAFDHQVTRAAQPGQDAARAHLPVGWSEVLVKVDNFGGPWGFYLEMVDPATHQPVPRIEVRTTPPAGFKVKTAPPFIREWQLLGPFACQPVQGHHLVLPPETDKVDLRKTYDGLRGKVRWRRYRSPGDYIDLAKIYNHRKAAVAYAVCWVRTEAARPVQLSIGSNDGVKVWVNRQLRFSHDIGRAAQPGQDKARTDLAAGWNEVLVKVDNRDNGWGFYLELLDPGTGRPLPGVEVRNMPPK